MLVNQQKYPGTTWMIIYPDYRENVLLIYDEFRAANTDDTFYISQADWRGKYCYDMMLNKKGGVSDKELFNTCISFYQRLYENLYTDEKLNNDHPVTDTFFYFIGWTETGYKTFLMLETHFNEGELTPNILIDTWLSADYNILYDFDDDVKLHLDIHTDDFSDEQTAALPAKNDRFGITIE